MFYHNTINNTKHVVQSFYYHIMLNKDSRYTKIDCENCFINKLLPCRSLGFNKTFPHKDSGVNNPTFKTFSRASAT